MIKNTKKHETPRKPASRLAQADLARVAGGQDPPPTKIRETLVGD